MMKVTLLFFLFTRERKGKFHNTHYARCVRKISHVVHVYIGLPIMKIGNGQGKKSDENENHRESTKCKSFVFPQVNMG